MRNFDEEFAAPGYRSIPEILSESEIEVVDRRLGADSILVAGDRRLLDYGWCQHLARNLLGRVLGRDLVKGDFVSVLCTYFSKNEQTNWGVAPHRDTCVPLRSKFDRGDWRNWTVKQGIPHAQPPNSFLRSMFAIRLNIDASVRDNGALEVVSGSHNRDAYCISCMALSKCRLQHGGTMPSNNALHSAIDLNRQADLRHRISFRTSRRET